MRHERLTVPLAAAFTVFGVGRRTPPASPPLSAISFMSGCWTGPSPNGATIEEHYSAASENMVIGMTRYVRNGRVVDFEFTTVERTDSTFIMTPRPKGVKSGAFPLKDVSEGRATWENLKHDFPQRIIYRRGTDGSLTARIEGTTLSGERHVEWTMHPCVSR
jgi:hypothetical protein